MVYHMIYMREHPLILLIDDEDNFLEIASVKLQANGFETIIVHTVPEALSKAEELLPDVILSDIYMPPGERLGTCVRRTAGSEAAADQIRILQQFTRSHDGTHFRRARAGRGGIEGNRGLQ